MSLREGLGSAWEGIAANKLRSSLTMLGVVIGVGTVVALLSIGAGATASITGRITSAGTNLLFISPGFRQRGEVQGSFGNASLTTADAAAIADPLSVPDVVTVAPEYQRNAQVIYGGNNTNTQITGITETYPDAVEVNLASGRMIDSQDVASRSNVAVLGADTASTLFGTADPIGQKIKLTLPGGTGERVSLTVVGLLEATGGATRFGGTDDVVLVPLTTAQYKLFSARNARGDTTVTSIVAVAADGRSTQAQAQIDDLLARRHGIAAGQTADFSVTNQADLLAVASDVTRTMTIFLGAIAVISLVVGGIGIMNIMLVSVTERTREIGVRKAVGARRWDILTQFLLEAVVLSVTGGVVGVAAGAGAAKAISIAGLMETLVSPQSVVLALGFSLAVGLISGIYPANRAAGLNPIEALRYE